MINRRSYWPLSMHSLFPNTKALAVASIGFFASLLTWEVIPTLRQKAKRQLGPVDRNEMIYNRLVIANG